MLFATGRGVAPWMASVTFGGPDLQTAYIGSLKGDPHSVFPRAGARAADGALEPRSGAGTLAGGKRESAQRPAKTPSGRKATRGSSHRAGRYQSEQLS